MDCKLRETSAGTKEKSGIGRETIVKWIEGRNKQNYFCYKKPV